MIIKSSMNSRKLLKFRSKYWDRVEQNKFRGVLRNGEYKEKSGITMSEYVKKLARDARYLTPAIPEYEIVEDLGKHFTPEIYNDLMQRVDTISEVQS